MIASTPIIAGPSTNDASSAAPSYENAASTSRRWSPSSRVMGRQRTRASGPTCGIAKPVTAAAAKISARGASGSVTKTTDASPAAPTSDCTSTTGRWPMRSASAPAIGEPTALAIARMPAAAPPVP